MIVTIDFFEALGVGLLIAALIIVFVIYICCWVGNLIIKKFDEKQNEYWERNQKR